MEGSFDFDVFGAIGDGVDAVGVVEVTDRCKRTRVVLPFDAPDGSHFGSLERKEDVTWYAPEIFAKPSIRL